MNLSRNREAGEEKEVGIVLHIVCTETGNVSDVSGGNSTHTIQRVCEEDSRLGEDSIVEERDGSDEVRDAVAQIVDQSVSTDSGDVTAEVDEIDAVDEDDEEDETKRDTEREQKKKRIDSDTETKTKKTEEQQWIRGYTTSAFRKTAPSTTQKIRT